MAKKATEIKTNSRKKLSDDAIFKARMNDMAAILSGLFLQDLGGKDPRNKVNSLDFLRSQTRNEILTLDRLQLAKMYMQFGLCQAIAEVPVYDAFRNEPIVKAYTRTKSPETSPVLPTDEPQGILKRLTNGIFGTRYNANKVDNDKEDKEIYVDPEDEAEVIARKKWQKQADKIDAEYEKNQKDHLYSPAEPWKVRAIKLAAKEQKLYDAFISANIWARVFGGGAVIINTPDSAGTPDTPLDLSKLKKGDRIDWIPVDCWELMGETPNTLVSSPDVSINWASDCPFNYYGVKIHKSRVLIFKGKEVPSVYRPTARGWGMSYFEHLARTLTITWKAQNSRAELLDDAKTDIYQLKGLNSQATNPQLNAGLQQRLGLIQRGKNYGTGITIDADDKYSSKQIQFSGFDKMQEQDRYDMAADARIVMTKLFGMSPSGFSNGDTDRASYEDMVQAEVQNHNTSNLIYAYKILAVVAVGEQMDIDVDWPALTKSDPVSQIDYKSKVYQLVLKAVSYGTLTMGQAARILNEQDIFFGVEVSDKLPLAPETSLTKFTTNPLMNKA